MSTLVVSTLVEAPLELVFATYTNLDQAADSIPSIVSVERLSEGPFGEGTRWRETRRMFGKDAVEEMWVTGYDPPRGFTVEADSHGMHYRTRYDFVPEGSGVRVSWTFGSTPHSLGARILAPVFGLLMKRTLTRCMQGDLEALRAVCEARAAGGEGGAAGGA